MTNNLVLPRVIGHRGTPKQAPENTLAGFAMAARHGVPWVELDVQLTRDEKPVVFHDEELDRTSTGQGKLVESELSYLRTLDAGAWFAPEFRGERLPTWEEVLDCLIANRLGVNIEIKADDDRAERTAEVALAIAQARWPAHLPAPLVTSFSRKAIEASRRFAPDWPRGLVADAPPPDWREFLGREKCASLHVRTASLDEAKVREIKQAGYAVLAWVVDEPATAHQLWNWGVDSIFSDRPEEMLR